MLKQALGHRADEYRLGLEEKAHVCPTEDNFTIMLFPIISVLPTITVPLKTPTALSFGDTLFLSCKATGYPRPKIKWLKNGNTDIKRANITKNHSVLSILQVTSNDSGNYECIASNTAGATKSRSTVAVFRKYLILSFIDGRIKLRKENVGIDAIFFSIT